MSQAPDGPGYLHEIKLDGYRMAARLDNGGVRLLTRTGLDWTTKYPAFAEALTELPATTAYLDGELCGVLPDGRTAFNIVQNAADTHGSLVFFVFDLLSSRASHSRQWKGGSKSNGSPGAIAVVVEPFSPLGSPITP